MKPNPGSKPTPSDASAHVKTAIPMLEKALDALRGNYADADIRTAAGQAASATRALRRACEALNASPASSAPSNTMGRG